MYSATGIRDKGMGVELPRFRAFVYAEISSFSYESARVTFNWALIAAWFCIDDAHMTAAPPGI